MRAKFNVSQTVTYAGGSTVTTLLAVTDTANPENKAFWEATPSGTIEITISNPSARDFLKVGEAYYVDFTEAS